jgi:hypothetical protein
MNGCELPGGAVLVVEPSDPSHKQRQAKNTFSSDSTADGGLKSVAGPLGHYADAAGSKPNEGHDQEQQPPGNGNESVKSIDDGRGEDLHDEENDDNLDDFFASLE